MFGYAGWILFALALLWIHIFRRTVGQSRLRLFSYLTMIMFDDVIREEQRTRFVEWVQTTTVDDERLIVQSVEATQEVADRLAKGDPVDSSINFTIRQILSAKEGKQPT